MAIKGSLREASLPDVLQLLTLGKKTGCLSVSHRANFGSIYFDRGRICFASIVNRRDRLGDLLVKNGFLTQDALNAGVGMQTTQREKRLGEILVAEGLISQDDLNRFIRMQIEEAVYFLFTWTEGTFNFEPDIAPDTQELLVSINPESLLLEGARRVDEWSLIEKKIPTFDLVFDLDHRKLAESEVTLTAEQETLTKLIDGRRDVAALVDEAGMGEFDVGKALYGLLTAGFLHCVGRSKPTPTSTSENRVEEHRNLGIAFYKTGMFDEATREFRRVIDLRDGDAPARFYLGLVLLRQGKWPDAANMFQDVASYPGAAAAVFHNLAYALERLGRYDNAQAAVEEAIRRGGSDNPRVLTSLAALRLRLGDPRGANACLTAARPLWGDRPPSPAWYHYAALAAALLHDRAKAKTILKEGIERYPVGALLNNLAVVLEREGDYAGAAQAADRAHAADATLPQPWRNLGDHHYRSGHHDEALDAYMHAVQVDPGLGGGVYQHLGNLRFRRGERDSAVKAWERSLELDPANTTVRNSLESARLTP